MPEQARKAPVRRVLRRETAAQRPPIRVAPLRLEGAARCAAARPIHLSTAAAPAPRWPNEDLTRWERTAENGADVRLWERQLERDARRYRSWEEG